MSRACDLVLKSGRLAQRRRYVHYPTVRLKWSGTSRCAATPALGVRQDGGFGGSLGGLVVAALNRFGAAAVAGRRRVRSLFMRSSCLF
jgi:hypothetical protein